VSRDALNVFHERIDVSKNVSVDPLKDIALFTLSLGTANGKGVVDVSISVGLGPEKATLKGEPIADLLKIVTFGDGRGGGGGCGCLEFCGVHERR
jgi:hypothetical protein